MTIEFLDEIIYSPNLLPAEHKSASQLLKLLTKEDAEGTKVDIGGLLSAPSVSYILNYYIFFVHSQYIFYLITDSEQGEYRNFISTRNSGATDLHRSPYFRCNFKRVSCNN